MGRLYRKLSRVSIFNVYSDRDKSLTATIRFVEFGSTPAFVGLWEFASTPQRRTVLQQAYAEFIRLYTADLSLPGPYLRARLAGATDPNQRPTLRYTVGNTTWGLTLFFPAGK